MPDLSTTWLGLELRNPIVASASPLSEDLADIERLAAAGVGAIVMHSLFEEQINYEAHDIDHFLQHGGESYAEALSYFPDISDYQVGPDDYLEHIAEAKRRVDVPIIGSLNGVSPGGWIRYATKIEQAGADALELNIFFVPTDPEMDANAVERIYVDLVHSIREAISIPLSVKLCHFFSAIPNLAARISRAGAQGLTLFNRFYEPDFDLDSLEVVPTLALSSPHELRLRLWWTAILYGRIDADIAITGGVHSARDVLKSMMAGARVAMTASALLRHGIDHVTVMLRELREWMEEFEYESIRQMQGSMSHGAVPEPEAFERANYVRVLRTHSNTLRHR
ncbi:MAG: dihydroorotate dehydrogenase-like protein [Candidatus Dadabacteria bacterium]|nr:MAG: dihydroorotate dehydrogenase-like protein [Candidatus Dadabacteria bacterium]